MYANTMARDLWFAQAGPAEQRNRFHPSGGYALRRNVLANEADDFVHGSSRLEDRRNADLLEVGDVLVGNDPADHYEYIVHLVLTQKIHDARDDGVVRPGKNGKTDDLHVFLESGIHDHFGRLPQARVAHCPASVAQGTRD